MKVIVMRGLPGSGKSTYANKLAELGPTTIVSADKFFMKDGVYKFDAAKIGDAHSSCLREFVDLIQNGFLHGHTVIVDNTNTTAREIAPYYQLALAFGHEVKIVSVKSPGVQTCIDRNVHGVPSATIARMDSNIIGLADIPPYWKVEYVGPFA